MRIPSLPNSTNYDLTHCRNPRLEDNVPSRNEIGRIVVHLEPHRHSVCREAVVGRRVMIVTRECHGVISLKVCKSLSSVFMQKKAHL